MQIFLRDFIISFNSDTIYILLSQKSKSIIPNPRVFAYR